MTISQFITTNEDVLSDREFHQFLYKGGIELILFSVKFVFNDLVGNKLLVAKAGHLWYEIASHQYMLYGNKRTSSALTRKFLKHNGLELDMDQEQEKSISWMISMNKITVFDLIKLIEPHIHNV